MKHFSNRYTNTIKFFFFTVSYGAIAVDSANTSSANRSVFADRASRYITEFYTRIVDDQYVDKTLLVEDYLRTVERYLIISRPSRWGKTLNLQMLRAFLEIEVDEKGKAAPRRNCSTRKLFVGGEITTADGKSVHLKPLHIGKELTIMKIHQGKYPVIFLDLSGLQCGTDVAASADAYETFNDGLKQRIVRVYSEHKYLSNSKHLSAAAKKSFHIYQTGNMNRTELVKSLSFLTELLFEHFKRQKKVHILIDSFDAAPNELFVRLVREHKRKFANLPVSELVYETYQSEEFERPVILLAELLSDCIKINEKHLDKVLMTGVFNMYKAMAWASLSRFKDCDLLRDRIFEQSGVVHFGFTRSEVAKLLTNERLTDKSTDIESWYGGYACEKYLGANISLHHPNSFLKCLILEGELAVYASENIGTRLINHSIISERNADLLRDLMAGKNVTVEITLDTYVSVLETGLFNILYFNGLLSLVNVTSAPSLTAAAVYTLRIPNEECRRVYTEQLFKNIR